MPLVTLHLKLPSQYWHAQRVRSGEDMEHTHTHFFKRRERDRDIQRETLDTKEKRKKRNRASSSSAHSPPQIAWTSQTIFSPPSLSLSIIHLPPSADRNANSHRLARASSSRRDYSLLLSIHLSAPLRYRWIHLIFVAVKKRPRILYIHWEFPINRVAGSHGHRSSTTFRRPLQRRRRWRTQRTWQRRHRH